MDVINGCSQTGLLQAEGSLLVSWGSDSPELSSKEYFLRTYPSGLDAVEAMLAVCREIGVSYVALVTDSAYENVKFQSAFQQLIARSGGVMADYGDWQITSILSLDLGSLQVAGYVESQLNELEYSHTRFTYLKAGVAATQSITDVSAAHGALGGLGEGRGWMLPKWVLEQVIVNTTRASRLSGWLTTTLAINTTDSSYEALAQNWNTSGIGALALNSTTTEKAIASWNAVFAVAQGIHSLFNQSIFPYNSDFTQQLAQTIQNSNISGAGLPVSFKHTPDTGNPEARLVLLNLNSTSMLVNVGQWSPTTPNEVTSFESNEVTWPGGSVPEDLTCRITIGLLYQPSLDLRALSAMEIARQEINELPNLIPHCTLFINSTRYVSKNEMVTASMVKMSIVGRTAVAALIGADTSDDTEVVKALMIPYNMSQIAFSSGSEKLDPGPVEQQITPTTFFRTCPSNSRLLAAAGKLVELFGWKEIAVISSSTRSSGADYLSGQAALYGYTVVGALNDVHAYSTQAAKSAAQTQLEQLVQSSYTTVFLMILSNNETWPLIEVANNAGFIRPGYTWLNAYTRLDVPKETLNGTDGTWTSLAQGMFCIHQEITNQVSWSTFNTKMNDTATFTSGYAYDSIYMLAEAITRAITSTIPVFSEAGNGLIQNPYHLAPVLRASNFSFQSVFQSEAKLSSTDSSPVINVSISNYDSGQWNVIGTSNDTHLTVSVQMDQLRFSDGTSIVPHDSSRVVIGVLVEDSVVLGASTSAAFTYARGAEARPAVAAAIQYVAQNKDTILTGYDLIAEIWNTDCNTGRALLGYSELQKHFPIAVVGGGCDYSTVSTQMVAESKEQVLMGYGAATNYLDNTAYFVSLAEGYSTTMTAFMLLSAVLELTLVGLVRDANWASTQQFDDLSSEYGLLVKTITTIDNTANIAALLETAYFSSATSFLAIVAANTMASLLDKLPDSRVHSGFLWFAPQLLMDPVTNNLQGWFTLKVSLDKTTGMYEQFHQLYENNRGPDSPNATYYSAAVFNGVLAVAQAASALFSETIYPTNNNFGAHLLAKIKDLELQRNVTGAGMNMTFASGGLGHVPYQLLNWHDDGAAVTLAYYNTLTGYTVPTESNTTADTRRAFTASASFVEYMHQIMNGTDSSLTLSFPGNGQAPVALVKQKCPPGQMNVNDYRCDPCPAGTYTSDPGYLSCSLCPIGTYGPNNSTEECNICPEGSTTWRKGVTSISECMCKENYYDTLRVEPKWTYVGCFQDCGNATSGVLPCPTNPDAVVSRDLPVKGGYQNGTMNLQMCNTICATSGDFDLQYFGVQAGTSCWCGNNPGSFGFSDTCTDTCVGSPNVECGGRSSNSVYRISSLIELRQGTQPQCAACPTTVGALEVKQGSACKGGWYAPIAKAKFWSLSKFPDSFYQCFHGLCEGGSVKGYVDLVTMQGNYSILQICADGAKGRMCAGCKEGYWKYGKQCKSCLEGGQKYLLYMIAPLLCLSYFPLLKYLIGGFSYSLGITNAFFQITALFGQFAVNWPTTISSLLAQVSLANFNWNFMFFACWDQRPKFIDNWVVSMLLPVFYAVFFMSRHYIYKALKIEPKGVLWCCTFCGRSISALFPAFFGGAEFYESAFSALLMMNMLYVGTLAKSLGIFACDQLPDGTYYLVGAPGVVCYEGDHVKLMVLAVIAIVVYSFGWPLFLFVAFRVSARKFLLQDAKFKTMLGFVYNAFDLDW